MEPDPAIIKETIGMGILSETRKSTREPNQKSQNLETGQNLQTPEMFMCL